VLWGEVVVGLGLISDKCPFGGGGGGGGGHIGVKHALGG